MSRRSEEDLQDEEGVLDLVMAVASDKGSEAALPHVLQVLATLHLTDVRLRVMTEDNADPRWDYVWIVFYADDADTYEKENAIFNPVRDVLKADHTPGYEALVLGTDTVPPKGMRERAWVIPDKKQEVISKSANRSGTEHGSFSYSPITKNGGYQFYSKDRAVKESFETMGYDAYWGGDVWYINVPGSIMVPGTEASEVRETLIKMHDRDDTLRRKKTSLGASELAEVREV